MLSSSLKGEWLEFNTVLQVVLANAKFTSCVSSVIYSSYSLLSIAFAPVLADLACDAGCLSIGVATAIVNNFLSLLANFNVDAANALAPNVAGISDIINYLTGTPLGSPTSRPWSAPPQHRTPVSVTNIDAVTCEGTIAFRRVAHPGTGETEAKGITVLYTTNSGDTNTVGPGGWQISHVFSELNTAAWIASLGLPCKPPRS